MGNDTRNGRTYYIYLGSIARTKHINKCTKNSITVET
eukprot:CAMPEP_0197296512 /NCGR_PEP_ID=MMETSP0890-20130614/38519_1 /TAXON_ID=44058 ORGANISM="Aureoumbra lagunensis, Strain CCMP1510" /NCGR_SAMPLE_ID=MMETSP0890 /ASSEMBLY_ACC=CAM_ASM_000533 /LENGTH=36 /DNA_ID= /DNA_START= /DNA_END= /DNA_ORIENTATION=